MNQADLDEITSLEQRIKEQAAEIAALRGRIREAYSMLRPLISWQGGEIYKPTIRLPALEEWEATPEVQRALEEKP